MNRHALLALALVAPLSLPARADKPDPALLEGSRQVAAGEYDAAIATLSAVVRRLAADPAAESQAAQAYLQLGIAYAGLGQLSPAKSQFVQALMRDPSLALDPGTVPPLAAEAFAAARAEGEREGVVSTDRRPRKKGSGGKLLLGALAAGAVGVAFAAPGSPGATPAPNPTFIPVITSPVIELLAASPGPGATFSIGMSVSLTLKATNSGERRLFFLAESLTADGRTCFSGQTLPFSAVGGTVTSTFGLSATCAAPFNTETLEVWLQDPETNARPYHASYRGGYRVVP